MMYIYSKLIKYTEYSSILVNHIKVRIKHCFLCNVCLYLTLAITLLTLRFVYKTIPKAYYNLQKEIHFRIKLVSSQQAHLFQINGLFYRQRYTASGWRGNFLNP